MLDAHVTDLDNLTQPDLGEPAAPAAPETPPAADENLSDLQAVMATYNALKAWMKEFKAVAKVVLRQRDDLLRELHL